ncbi:hypothetical protein [Corynebacterium bovis]|nr:hypothetical protein [Corynebacterium bovis]
MTSTTPDPADHSSDRAHRPHPDTTGTGTTDADTTATTDRGETHE